MVAKTTSSQTVFLLSIILMSVMGQVSPYERADYFEAANVNGLQGTVYQLTAKIDIANGESVEAAYEVEVFNDKASSLCNS